MSSKIQISLRIDSSLLSDIDKFVENRTEVIHYFLMAGLRNKRIEQDVRALAKRFQEFENDMSGCKESFAWLNAQIGKSSVKSDEAFQSIYELNKTQMKTISSITTRVINIKEALQSAQKVLWGIVVGISVLGLGGSAWWLWFSKTFLRH